MMVKFGKSTIYGAPGGRIAVGVDVEAKLEARTGAPTHGRIWMTAVPVNKPGSAEVHFTDLAINGNTDGVGGDLLIVLRRTQGFATPLAAPPPPNFPPHLPELQRHS